MKRSFCLSLLFFPLRSPLFILPFILYFSMAKSTAMLVFERVLIYEVLKRKLKWYHIVLSPCLEAVTSSKKEIARMETVLSDLRKELSQERDRSKKLQDDFSSLAEKESKLNRSLTMVSSLISSLQFHYFQILYFFSKHDAFAMPRIFFWLLSMFTNLFKEIHNRHFLQLLFQI
jgi:hypothetical protein